MTLRPARSIEQLQLRFAQIPQSYEALEILIAEVAAIGEQVTEDLEGAFARSLAGSESNAA